MFDSLKKKLKEGVKKLSKKIKEKQDLTFEQEEQFTHEKEVPVDEVLKEEEEKIEQEKEAEEHFEAEPVPEPEEIPKPIPKPPKPVPGPEETTKPEPEETDVPEEKDTLEERIPEEPKETLEDQVLEKEEVLEKKGFLKRLKSIPIRIKEKTLSAEDIDSFISEIESDLLSSNVALDVIDFFKSTLKEELESKSISRGKSQDILRQAFESTLFKIVDQGSINLETFLKEDPPKTLLFLGFNGSGKTTSIAKVAKYLKDKKFKPVLAAGDTFRAASIEQLDYHASKLGLKVIKHHYGSDPAAVVFDAKKHAKAHRLDVVLADTAGRTHIDKNLLDELKKIVRVNKPDLKILVVDSLTGNDAVEQARLYHKAVGVDAVILTKLDVNKKGGSILSVAFAIKKPILFLGVGQNYSDLIPFEPRAFVKELLS